MLAKFLLAGAFASAAIAQTPTFTLPWGTWEGTYYEPGDYYVFTDIRFAKPPTGSLRFQKSEFPDPVSDPTQPTTGPSAVACLQVDTSKPGNCNVPPGGRGFAFLSEVPEPQQEDCLFFDLYVPKSVYDDAQQGIANTPVVNWIFGGAYLFGTKRQFGSSLPWYNGTGLIETLAAKDSTENLIFVAGNYRLGALGWLAGATMEQYGQPNAGLWDQHLLLQLIQEQIGQVGGDKTQVSAWGESAGAGSIYHHLVAEWPDDEGPLFSKALLESPAYQWAWDRKGTLDNDFQKFQAALNCSDDGVECMQGISEDIIWEQNEAFYLNYTSCNNIFDVGPAVDGSLISQLPTVSYSQKKVANLDSLIVSHVQDEAGRFVDKSITTPDEFNTWLGELFPEDSLEGVVQSIVTQYPNPADGDEFSRLRAVVRDSAFTCNTRNLFEAYQASTPTYMMSFSFFNGSFTNGTPHAFDLLPTFWNKDWDLISFLKDNSFHNFTWGAEPAKLAIDHFSYEYIPYYLSHALTGDPNKFDPWVPWNVATNSDDDNTIENVMLAGNKAYDLWKNDFQDPINTADACDFWIEVAQNISDAFPSASSLSDSPVVVKPGQEVLWGKADL